MMRMLMCVAVMVGSMSCAAMKSSSASKEKVAAQGKPNIILILTDDVGLGNIGCSGGAFKTPNIDALAKGGTRFAQCYSTPLCGPTRAQLLTGRYPFRTGMVSNGSGPVMKPANEVMIQTVLKQAGYVTAQTGKWSQLPLQPGDWGFDEYLSFPRSGRFWRQQTATYTLNGQEKDLPENVHLPDLMHDFAVDFVKRNREKPFFLYYSMSHIHGPIVRTPDSKPGADNAQLYKDNVEYMDKLVGKLMDELEKQKLREKTLVIFTGDNGTAANWAPDLKVNGKSISGHKATMLEGGSRVPCIVNWPGTTPAGKVRDDLVDFSDFFVTIADVAGAKLPEKKIDGHSIAAQIRGKVVAPCGGAPYQFPREWAYVELNGKRYVRDERYKLTGTGELFDLKNAPFEEIPANDAAARQRLQKVLDDLAKDGSPGAWAREGAATMQSTQPADRAERRRLRRQQRARESATTQPAPR